MRWIFRCRCCVRLEFTPSCVARGNVRIWCLVFLFLFFSFLFCNFGFLFKCSPSASRNPMGFAFSNWQFFRPGSVRFFFNLDRTAAPTTCSHKNKIERNRLEAETITWRRRRQSAIGDRSRDVTAGRNAGKRRPRDHARHGRAIEPTISEPITWPQSNGTQAHTHTHTHTHRLTHSRVHTRTHVQWRGRTRASRRGGRVATNETRTCASEDDDRVEEDEERSFCVCVCVCVCRGHFLQSRKWGERGEEEEEEEEEREGRGWGGGKGGWPRGERRAAVGGSQFFSSFFSPRYFFSSKSWSSFN